MKILQINCVYKSGSTGKIVYDIHKVLQESNFESIVCYGRGKKIEEKNVYKVSNEFISKFYNIKSRFTGMQYAGCFVSTINIINIIKKENPHIVHLHCINGYFVNIYKLIEFLKQNKINTVLTLHAEFMYTGNCGHSYECDKWKCGCGNCPQLKKSTNSYFSDKTNESWNKMKEVFQGFDNLIVTSVSPWLENRAKQSPILADKIHYTVLNGIETKGTFYPRKVQCLKEKHSISNEKIILHVTANFESEAKGGKYIIELAKRMKDEKVKIIVIGNKNRSLKLPSNIIDIGRVENQDELAMYYSMADVTVITSKRETFSMVCAESLSCGTPIIGFKSGGPEQVSLHEYSEFVEYGDIELLQNTINKWLLKNNYLRKLRELNVDQYYSKERMCSNYIKIYNQLLNGEKNEY